jgi:CubicO group peptidase (beta-lactamase class C family)
MAELARVPLLYQPGEAWLYDTCSTLQGILIARVAGQSLPGFLAERVFAPLGMSDTGFEVPGGKSGRFTSYYRATPAGGLELADGPDGQWSTRPHSRWAMAGWPEPPMTGLPSAGCCWPKAPPPTAGGC